MTSLLPALRPPRPDSEPRRPRGLVTIAFLGGLAAAASTLLVALALGVIGWFASDAGAHGTPSDGLRVAAVAWLTGHGSGVGVQGTAITMIPLGLTLVLAVVCARLGLRVGEALAGHGPDADRLADGERDWTVPLGVALFTAGYLIVLVVTALMAGEPGSGVSLRGAVAGGVLLAGGVGGLALTAGSGRAAQWTALLSADVRAVARSVAALVLVWCAYSAAVLALGLALGFSEAASIYSRLGLDGAGALQLTGLALLLLPNAALMAGAYALGPGFALGTGTVVAPTAVALGPVPLFPLVAATPGTAAPEWAAIALSLAPCLLAAVVVWAVERGAPSVSLLVGAARGGVAGLLAGLLVGLLSARAGGAVGPGRMGDVGAFAGDVTVQAVVTLVSAGVIAGLVAAWTTRRRDARA